MQYTESKYNIIIEQNEENIWLYNSYSGAFAKIEVNVYNQFHNQEIDSNNKCQYFDELLKQRFIKPKDNDEFFEILTNERRTVYDKSKKELLYVISPTLACNLNCVYCFESNVRDNKVIDDATLSGIVEFIGNQISSETEKIHINWFGGEPLLAYDKIVKFYELFNEFIADKNIKHTAGIITNGILFDEQKIKCLCEIAHLDNVQITVDGTENEYCKQKCATKEQFYKLMENIKIAVQYVKVSIRLNVCKSNYDDIKSVAEMLISSCSNSKNLNVYLARILDYEHGSVGEDLYCQSDFDVIDIQFKKFISEKFDAEQKPNIPKYKKTFCGLFKLNNLVIGPYGELYKCEHFVGQKDKIIGNITVGVLSSEKLYDFLENKTPIICRDCQLFPLCISGCPAQKEIIPDEERCHLSMWKIKEIIKNYIK